MTLAEAIARLLEQKGVSHAFGIIGAGNVSLFDALARHQKTELVPVHHEQSAVMAASFYARLKGVGVAVVTTGAGSANAVTGALAALMDSVPIVIISGNEPSRYMDAETRVIGVQGYHTWRVAQHVTKSAWKTTSPSQALAAIDYAFDDATADRPGPYWIDIPRDYFNAMV